MSYIEISKRSFGVHKLPDNILRISKRTMTVSGNVAERIQTTRYHTKSGSEALDLGLAIDVENKRIKLSTGAVNGFQFRGIGGNNSMTANSPVGLRRSGMPIGDYLLVGPTENLEFQLAE